MKDLKETHKEEEPVSKCLMETKHYKDKSGGDCGMLQKKGPVTPYVFFVRSCISAKQNAQMPHPELAHVGKAMKQFYITTGLGIAYFDDFEVHLYNI